MTMRMTLSIDLPTERASFSPCPGTSGAPETGHGCGTFYWVVPHVLGGMGLPCCEPCVRDLKDDGVGVVVSLTEECEADIPSDWFENADIVHFSDTNPRFLCSEL